MRVSRRRLLKSLGVSVVAAGLAPERAAASRWRVGTDEGLIGTVRWTLVRDEAVVPQMGGLDLAVVDTVSDISLQFLADNNVAILSRVTAGDAFRLPDGPRDRHA